MKKFTFILLFPLLIAASNGQLINVLNMYNAAGAACTEGTPVSTCTTSNGQTDMDSDADGIQFTAGSTYSEWGHAFRANVASGSGVIEVRVGNSSDLTTYTAHMQITVTNTDTAAYVQGQWLDSGDVPVKVDFTNTSTYYIGMAQVSGDTVRWQRDAVGDPCANHSGRSASAAAGWNMANSNAYDWNHKSIPCN